MSSKKPIQHIKPPETNDRIEQLRYLAQIRGELVIEEEKPKLNVKRFLIISLIVFVILAGVFLFAHLRLQAIDTYNEQVVAGQIKAKVLPYYQQIGISAQNTTITINQDGTYSATFRGTPMNGKWTYDEASCRMNLQGLLLSLNCYAKRNVNGIALLFDASKLLTLLQTAAAMSGNQNIQTVGEISKSYDGVRLGFDFSK